MNLLKNLLLSAILLFCFSASTMADNTLYTIDVKNTTKYIKVFTMYYEHKNHTDEIGLASPDIRLTLKPNETKTINIEAGVYSIIEKTPSKNYFGSYMITIPQDLIDGQSIPDKIKKEMF